MGAAPLWVSNRRCSISPARPLSCCAPAASPSKHLTELLGPIAMPAAAEPRSPGMLPSHYAPVAATAPRGDRSPPGRSSAGLRPRRPAGFRRGAVAQPFRRPGRGGGEFVRDAAPARPAPVHRHRGDADPRARARPGDQRPAAPRRRTAARLSTEDASGRNLTLGTEPSPTEIASRSLSSGCAERGPWLA